MLNNFILFATDLIFITLLLASACFDTFEASIWKFSYYIGWLRITDETSVPNIKEWLELHAEKQVAAGSLPGGGGTYFTLASRCSQLGEDHTNEIKHVIHPE